MQRRCLVMQLDHHLGWQAGLVEWGFIGVHLVAGRVQVNEPITWLDRGRKTDLAPRQHVAFQAGRAANAGEEHLRITLGMAQQLWVGQVLTVEPLLGQAEAAALYRDDGIAFTGVAILDA